MKKLWIKCLSNIGEKGIELPTAPKNNREPVWFRTYAYREFLCIEGAKNHKPSSQLSTTRKISYEEFERVYPLYLKREVGESVSKELAETTYNQVYILSIIKHFI